MIELLHDQLTFRFPEVHEKAFCHIEFQRTLRIPDDNQPYPLPPGLGQFPLSHVDDYADRLPASWRKHGGVFIPMYQSEALWINFSGNHSSGYPFAGKIAAGKINAVSGQPWSNELDPDSQDYVVIPGQPWLDGFNVTEDYIRQFIAMPLGEGFTAEEQITGEGEYGGLQIIVYPMKREEYIERFEKPALDSPHLEEDLLLMDMPAFCRKSEGPPVEMGLAPGGLMRQKIVEDKFGLDVWDQENGLRCFIHLANSEQYRAITGHRPPHTPPSAKQYTDAGLPWFDYYDDQPALAGSVALGKLTSLAAMTIQKGKSLLGDNQPVEPKIIKQVRRGKTVRDGDF